MARVMIAIDGTELDRRLMEVAERVFGADAEYWAVNVRRDPAAVVAAAVPPMNYGMAYPYMSSLIYEPRPIPGVQEVTDQTEEARWTAAEAAADAGLTDEVVPLGDVGDPADVIVAAAEQHDVDVVVVGTHDRGWLSRLMEPSVSSAVLKSTRRPVMVVHTDGDGAGDGDESWAEPARSDDRRQ